MVMTEPKKENQMPTEKMEIETVQTTQAPAISNETLIMYLENLGLLKDLSTGEKNTYLQIAKAFNLNPFKREIHVSKYNGQMSIITGYEVYIKRAERTGQLDGWQVETSGTVEAGDLKAVITIHRKDRKHPFTWEALYSEYVQTATDKVTGQLRPTKFWQKAHTMTKKIAISQGFRLCFSDELGGMPYAAEEINAVPTEDIPHEVMPEDKEVKQAKRTAPIVKQKAQPPAVFNESLRDELKSLLFSAVFNDEERRDKALAAVTACGNMHDYTNIKLALLKFQPAGTTATA